MRYWTAMVYGSLKTRLARGRSPGLCQARSNPGRIINAVFAIETSETGGTMHAVTAALSIGRPRFVPDASAAGYPDLTIKAISGTQQLVRSQKATPYTRESYASIRFRLEKIADQFGSETQQNCRYDFPMIKALILDLDDTLIDTTALESLRKAKRWKKIKEFLSSCSVYEDVLELFKHGACGRHQDRDLHKCTITLRSKSSEAL